MELDANKIFKYNFVEKHKWEPIIVKRGQHLHLSQSYYHPSTSERFFYGEGGENFEKAENLDMGVFKVKESSYYSSATTLAKGQLPGLLF